MHDHLDVYLQSRYYNPEVGRFINADALVSTGQGFTGNNMFAYCSNNPIMYTDPTGLDPASAGIIAGVAALVALVMVVGVITINNVIDEISESKEVYVFSRIIRASLAALDVRRNIPAVHHIVPKGDFSNRNAETRRKIKEMHNVLKNAGIDYKK